MKYNTKGTEEKMQKSVNAYESNLSTIRASQANGSVVSKVTFEYYGAATKLVDMASVAVTDPKTLVIQPWDASTHKNIEKAILASDIGITPMSDGKVIRLTFPQPTEERRRELTKQTAKMGEDTKVGIRNIRRDAVDAAKAMKKNSEMTEDELKSSEKLIQDLTDKYIKEIDAVTAKKNAEIMEV